jgi:hypothetical protein
MCIQLMYLLKGVKVMCTHLNVWYRGAR